MANKWIPHVMKTMKMMKKKGTYEKGKGLAQVIKEAKKTWKKGGAEGDAMPAPAPAPASKESPVSETPAEEGGRRRRRGSKKTRRVRKH